MHAPCIMHTLIKQTTQKEPLHQYYNIIIAPDSRDNENVYLHDVYFESPEKYFRILEPLQIVRVV